MLVFVSGDGDGIGALVGRASLHDDVEEIRRLDHAIKRASEIFTSWATASGGEIISAGGDEFRVMIPVDRLSELPNLRAQYESACGHTCTVGVGMKLSEADKALLVGKLRGKDRTVLWQPEMQEELDEAVKGSRTEADKLAEEYLKSERPFKAAAFRNRQTGQIIETGTFHDVNKLPVPEHLVNQPPEYRDYYDILGDNWEDGFTTHGGDFLNRANAAQAVKMPNREGWVPGELYSEHPEAGLRKFVENSQDTLAARDGENTVAHQPAPVGEASQSKTDAGVTAKAADRLKALAQQQQEAQSAPAPEQPGQPTTGGDAPQQEAGGQDEGQDAGQMVLQALQNFKNQAPVLEHMKEANPEAYKAVLGLVQAMLLMAKMGTSDNEEEVAKAEGELLMKARMHHRVCRCTAYIFPHRHKGGKCKGAWVMSKAEIHNDPKDPKKVYRVEAGAKAGKHQGDGPYRTTHDKANRLANQSLWRDLKAQPIPGADFPEEEHPFHQNVGGANHVFAFENPEKAREWFGDNTLRELAKHNFHLREVPAIRILRSISGKQVMVLPHPSYKPGTGKPIKLPPLEQGAQQVLDIPGAHPILKSEDVWQVAHDNAEHPMMVYRVEGPNGEEPDLAPIQKDDGFKNKTLHHNIIYPVGTVQGDTGKVKIQHSDGRTGWVQVRAGQIMSADGHAISSRNPGGK